MRLSENRPELPRLLSEEATVNYTSALRDLPGYTTIDVDELKNSILAVLSVARPPRKSSSAGT